MAEEFSESSAKVELTSQAEISTSLLPETTSAALDPTTTTITTVFQTSTTMPTTNQITTKVIFSSFKKIILF